LLRWTLPVAVRGRSWAISNRRGRHRSRAVGAGRRNDIEHDLRETDCLVEFVIHLAERQIFENLLLRVFMSRRFQGMLETGIVPSTWLQSVCMIADSPKNVACPILKCPAPADVAD